MSVGVIALMISLSACSTEQWEKAFAFGWPLGITTQSHAIRGLWTWSIVAALAVGALVWGLIFWACIAYRRRDAELPRQTKYNLPIDSLTLADRLATEHSVMLAPGSAFGYENHLRLGIGQRPDIFAEGLERAGKCFEQLRA